MNSDGFKNGLVWGLAQALNDRDLTRARSYLADDLPDKIDPRHLRSDTARQGLRSPCACIRIFVSLLVTALRYAR
jgi:hypothetical protein